MPPMPKFPFAQVDAFTDTALAGNPCAVVFDADELDSATMQAIAVEMNLSETAFVLRSDKADVRARYFTPAEEIPLAGHPTVATVFALAESGRIALRGPRTVISLQLEVGPIPIVIEATDDEPARVRRIIMEQKTPEFGASFAPEEIASLFGLEPALFLPGARAQIVSTGTPQLMVPLISHKALRNARLEFDSYRAFRSQHGFFSAHFFCLEGFTPAGRTSARHFGVPPDTFEDPFTGSATGGMGAYLWHHGLIDEPNFVAEQGHWMRRPGQAFVEVVGPRDAIETVRVGGPAITVMRGELTL